MTAETAQRVRAALEPLVRPREEATRIRRVLAAHLATHLKSNEALDGNLALVEVPGDVVLPLAETGRGLQLAYLQALQAHLAARRAFDQTSEAAAHQQRQYHDQQRQQSLQATEIGERGPMGPSGLSILDEQLERARLARKKQRLEAVAAGLDALAQQPAAAAEDFLQQEAIYAEATRTLPPVPKAVMDGLAEDAATTTATAAGISTEQTTADIQSLVAQLEQAVLRTQLQLRQEEKRLAKARARMAGSVPAWARLQALSAARDELIGWMEAELSQAGGDDDKKEHSPQDEEAEYDARQLRRSLLGGGDGSHDDGRQQQRVEEAVATVRHKYGQYVAARQRLVQMTGGRTGGMANVPSLAPTPTTTTTTTPTATNTAPTDLGPILLTPYLTQLLAVSRQQKAAIAHKAHHQAVLARRLGDACRMIDHLADESQLLPRFPPGSGVVGHGVDGLTRRATAWTVAADAAKLATFETVAERLEAGQDALEEAAQTLDEADALLGRGDGETGDIWAALDGELGLLKEKK